MEKYNKKNFYQIEEQNSNMIAEKSLKNVQFLYLRKSMNKR